MTDNTTPPTPSTSHDGDPVTFDGDVMVIRASALGGCSRAMAALVMGHDKMAPPESMQRRFDDGHLHEQSILDEIARQAGATITPLTDTVEFQVTKNLVIRGHLDGTTVDPVDGKPGVAEAKAFSKSMFTKYRASGLGNLLGYQYQLAVYMLATGSTFALYGVKNKDSGEVDVKRVDGLPISRAKVIQRALEIQKVVLAAKEGKEGGDVAFTSCDKPQFPCPVYYLHQEVDIGPITEDAVLKGLAEDYDDARKREALAKVEKDRIGDEIRMRLEVMGETRMQVGDWVLSADLGSRTVLDEAAVCAALGVSDLSSFKTSKPNSKATLNVKGGGQK